MKPTGLNTHCMFIINKGKSHTDSVHSEELHPMDQLHRLLH